ncbi:phosphodiesterase [Leptothoe sp. LEGE 181152]|nr:phosphodiesterase [Leptothoe sp. LEGE 181152]
MSHSILLAQVTDSHLLAKTTDQLRGCNTWQTFNAVLREVTQCKPDGLLLTGDLAEQGEAEAYGNLVDALSPLQIPTYWLPGNHDRLDMLQQVLQVLPASQGLSSIDLGPWQLILLDSVFLDATFGEGHLSAQQLQKLRFYLTHHPPKPTLIALHHHPVSVGIDWVDQIGVKNADEFFALIEQFSQVKLVVFGHIHHEFQHKTARGIGVYGCPSTCLQVTPAVTAMDDTQPGFRLVRLYGDGRYETEVRRVNIVDGER